MELIIQNGACVGVAGAGAMGRGIALVAAHAGHKVILFDAFDGVAEKALSEMHTSYERLVQKQKYAASEARAILDRITPTSQLNDLADAELVIEAIVENLEIKTALFTELENIVSDETILTTNTSSLSVTEIAKSLQRPDQFAGFHFFNPANRMPLVEVVRRAESSEESIEILFSTAKAWGKTPVICQSRPGFIVNRVARPFYAEALRLMEEQAADHKMIDSIMKECGGFRMGPLELTDLIGHDVNFAVTQSVYEAFFHDPRYKPSLIQQELVRAGNFGRKSGKGFYNYQDTDYQVPPSVMAPVDREPDRGPKSITVYGSDGAVQALAAIAEKQGLQVSFKNAHEKLDRPCIVIDDISITLTDGQLATELAHEIGSDVCLLDFAFDFTSSEMVAISFNADAKTESTNAAIGFFQALGKKVVSIKDSAAMIVTATLAMIINEAVDAANQGLASPEDIDLAMIKGVNYPGGPFGWMKVFPARKAVSVLDNLNRIYPSGRYRASPLLRKMALKESL